ncbi:MAG: sterol desaturase family protein [Deltaproteobacteria bacterium]|nr:sterol desaturase family protein [Deltaproteobacteria bacterium]
MTMPEFLTNATIILGIMALFALIETIVPFFACDEARTGRGSANLGLTVLTFVLNWGLSSAAALVALGTSRHGIGLATNLISAMPTQIAFSVVVLDFSTYIAHRSMHLVPLLWRMHQVHHSDPFVDVSTTYRQHPLEGLWRFLWMIGPAWTLGLPATGIVVYRLISAVNAILEHANIRLWQPLDGILSLFWVTPNMHKVHHSRECAETDSNYGNIFAFYDRVLGTFTPTDRAFEVAYGLDGMDPNRTRSFFGLLSMPFRCSRAPVRERRGYRSRFVGV